MKHKMIEGFERNDFVSNPYARDYYPGEPKHQSMEKFNSQLRELVDPQGDLFVAVSPPGWRNRYRANVSYLEIYRVCEEPKSGGMAAVLQIVVKDNQGRPLNYIPKSIFQHLLMMDKSIVPQHEIDAFNAKLDRLIDEEALANESRITYQASEAAGAALSQPSGGKDYSRVIADLEKKLADQSNDLEKKLADQSNAIQKLLDAKPETEAPKKK